jgi:type IV secretory pathway TraG/TraD family ATPase VirD4
MASQWGRKETVLWPPQVPIYTVGTMLLAVPIVVSLLFGQYLVKPFLARNYTGDYLKSSAGSVFKMHNSFRLIYLFGGKRTPRVAQQDDFVPGTTILPSGKEIGVQLSPAAVAQGYSSFARGTERKIDDEALCGWFKAAIYGGDDLLSAYAPALIEAGVIITFLFCFAVPWDFKRGKRMKYGRLLRGPVMSSPKQFNEILKGEGLGIRTTEKGTIIRLPLRAEAKHVQVMGDTGVGKTTLLIQMLTQIEDRGESAIVYDPAGEYVQRFFNKDRNDVILNPLDDRMPDWVISSELRNPAEARTIAASLYQPPDGKPGEFFTDTPQKLFAHLLKYRPSTQELVAWMSNPEEIDRRVKGTELEAFISKDAPDQRQGVLGSLGLIADSLRLLPGKTKPDQKEWSATEWADKREGWIFLTGTEAEQEALRPLHSLWIDLLILRLLTIPKPGQKRAWFVLDELATLQRLPQFHSALTKGRKSDNPIIFGYQGKAQLEVIYGHLAEVMLSQPATKFILKTSEPKAAKWASELIGEIEIERVRETMADGKRAGKSFTLDRQIEPLVMSSEIEGLEDLHTFMKLGNNVTRFSFPHIDRPARVPSFVHREIAETAMWFNPLAPEPSGTPSATAPVILAPVAPTSSTVTLSVAEPAIAASALSPADNVARKLAEMRAEVMELLHKEPTYIALRAAASDVPDSHPAREPALGQTTMFPSTAHPTSDL